MHKDKKDFHELKKFLSYLVLLMVFFVAMSYSYPLYVAAKKHRANHTPNRLNDYSAFGKSDFVTQNRDRFDVIVLGDSRACIGISPAAIEKETGKRVFNGASLANWLQTQYPQYKKLLPALKGKTVVWTIGNTNFKFSNDVGAMSMSLEDFVFYTKIGMPPKALIDNLMMSVFDHNVVFLNSSVIRGMLDEKMKRPVYNRPIMASVSDSGDSLMKIRDERLEYCKSRAPLSDPNVIEAGYAFDTKKPEAVYRISRADGQLEYCEVDQEYFRTIQRNSAIKARKEPHFKPDPRFEKIFDATLKEFKKNDIRLIVNEYWDAPYTYDTQENRERCASYMKKIEKKVRSYGFEYITVDFSDMKDPYYFDHNHLNSEGADKYSHKLAKKLREVL